MLRESESDRPLLFCVTGCDGAGKSTIVEDLLRRLRGRGVNVACVSLWDNVCNTGATPWRSREDIKRYGYNLAPRSRFLFVLHLWTEALKLASQTGCDVWLLDAYWYKYAATEAAFGESVPDMCKLAGMLPTPSATWYLELSPSIAASRKAAFSAYETGYGVANDREAFVAFQTQIAATMDRVLSPLPGLTCVDGANKMEAISLSIFNEIVAFV